MKENRSKNKSFSAKGWIAGIITANILGILAWLLPMLGKDWLLSISLEDFYAKYTATFMFCHNAACPKYYTVVQLKSKKGHLY